MKQRQKQQLDDAYEVMDDAARGRLIRMAVGYSITSPRPALTLALVSNIADPLRRIAGNKRLASQNKFFLKIAG